MANLKGDIAEVYSLTPTSFSSQKRKFWQEYEGVIDNAQAQTE